jgi:UDP-glucose 4-epimerase
MRALVTGAAGFLGFHLARALAARGLEVVCVDNFERGEDDAAYRALLALPNVSGITADLASEAAVGGLPLDIDYVYHLAALNGTQNFYERPLDVIRFSTIPTMLLAEKYGPTKGLKRFVYAGTSEAYATTVSRFGWPVPTAEDVPLGIADVFNPRWSYAVSKLHGEVVTAQASRAFDMPMSIVRYHNAYGPRMGDKHVVPDFLERAKDGRFELYGYEDTRSFMYVDDSIRATVAIAETPDCTGEIVNVGSSHEITILELGQTMMRIMGRNDEIVLHPSPAGSVKRRAPSLDKLTRLTGFRESIGLEDGLRNTMRFYLDGVLQPIGG